MAGRDAPRGPDPDDWFWPPGDVSPRTSAASGTAATASEPPWVERDEPATADDWLGYDPGTARTARARPRRPNVNPRAVLAAGAVAVVLLVGGLAIGGVFSGGSKPRTIPPTTNAPPTTTAAQTPTKPSKPAAVAAPTTALRAGAQGAQVKLLQRALKSLGDSPGAVDGRFGPLTQAALTRFQHASGLAADGILGPKTLKALKLALQHRG